MTIIMFIIIIIIIIIMSISVCSCLCVVLSFGQPRDAPSRRAHARRREQMVGVNMVLALYPQNTLCHRICIVHV